MNPAPALLPAGSPLRARLSLALALSLLPLLACLAEGQGQTSSTGAAAIGAAAPAAPVPGPARAVFTDDPERGKDPFFPHSQRRFINHRHTASTNSPPRIDGVLGQLVLKGISSGKERRLALINNVTVAEGEVATVRLPSQTAQVRCLEIRDRSVLVALDGAKEVRELQLRKGL